MAVGYRSSTATVEDQVSAVDVPVPSGAAAGDIALVGIGVWWNSDVGPITPPADFTLVASVVDNLSLMAVYWKRLTAAEAGSWTFSFTASRWVTSFGMLVTGGVASGDPIEAFDTATGTNGGAYPTTTVTVATAAFLGHFVRHEASGTTTPPTGFTEAEDMPWACLNYQALPTAGTHSASGGSTPASDNPTVLVAVAAESSGPEVHDFTANLGITTATTAAQSKTASPSAALGLTVAADTDQDKAVGLAATEPITTDMAATLGTETHDFAASLGISAGLTANQGKAGDLPAGLAIASGLSVNQSKSTSVVASAPIAIGLQASASDQPPIDLSALTLVGTLTLDAHPSGSFTLDTLGGSLALDTLGGSLDLDTLGGSMEVTG